MSLPRPLGDDWLFWDPETIHAYPAVDEDGDAEEDAPEQMDLFDRPAAPGDADAEATCP